MTNCTWWSCNKEAGYSDGKFCSVQCANKYRVDLRRREVKLRLVLYRGGCCAKCGYAKCVEALEFHHRDPSTKSFSLGSADVLGWEALLREADKCDLLCANCHRETESAEFAERWDIAKQRIVSQPMVTSQATRSKKTREDFREAERSGRRRSPFVQSKALPKGSYAGNKPPVSPPSDTRSKG